MTNTLTETQWSLSNTNTPRLTEIAILYEYIYIGLKWPPKMDIFNIKTSLKFSQNIL